MCTYEPTSMGVQMYDSLIDVPCGIPKEPGSGTTAGICGKKLSICYLKVYALSLNYETCINEPFATYGLQFVHEGPQAHPTGHHPSNK